MMKRLIASILLFFFIFSTNANTGDNLVEGQEYSDIKRVHYKEPIIENTIN